MFQLLIILLFLSNLPSIHGPSCAKTTLSAQNELQVLEVRENTEETDLLNIQIKESDSSAFRTKNNAEGTTYPTLEECFPRVGRFLSPKRDKKKDPIDKGRCYCRCYRRLSQRGATNFPEKHPAKFEEFCLHIEAGDYDMCADVDFHGRTAKTKKNAAGVLKASSLRSTNNPIEAQHQPLLDLGRYSVSDKVQRLVVRGWKTKTKSRDKKMSMGSREMPKCCCEKFCENVCRPIHMVLCGLPLLCIVNTCQCCCDRIFRFLDKYCNC